MPRTNRPKEKKAIGNFAKGANAPVVYCNQTGANTELIFDGKSGLYGENGPLSLTPAFTSCAVDISTSAIGYSNQVNEPWEEEVLQALTLGMRDYFHKLRLSQAILGLSGGLDSALVAYIACQAIGAENVLGVLMPSQFSSDHSVNDALARLRKGSEYLQKHSPFKLALDKPKNHCMKAKATFSL